MPKDIEPNSQNFEKKLDLLIKRYEEQKGIISSYIKREREWKRKRDGIASIAKRCGCLKKKIVEPMWNLYKSVSCLSLVGSKDRNERDCGSR